MSRKELTAYRILIVTTSVLLAVILILLRDRIDYREVYSVCDRSHLSRDTVQEEECAKLLKQTNTEYICNSYCWLEIK